MLLRRECTCVAGGLTARSSRGNPAGEERSGYKETNLLRSPLWTQLAEACERGDTQRITK
jgi:hypothetical protein